MGAHGICFFSLTKLVERSGKKKEKTTKGVLHLHFISLVDGPPMLSTYMKRGQ